ncbi:MULTISPECIES: hypothetical protein [unclassified Paenibacillus]|jgi:hypothetical protein|uniref:hypothetical protein n=1 Tax=unclassified Paenibacillus TaxID=185978 RepID=UPI0004F7476E|nr:hypothetical protein [Paenibacillus sp. FSL P4-0081]AIQ29182.1 hypothetical protein P40081_14190 [Paenibacillus sp. FSL P4-0081]
MLKLNRFTSEFVKRITVMLILLTLWPGVAPQVSAASDWDSALEEIHNLYSAYTELQVVLKSEIQRNQELRKQNNTALTAVNAKLQSTDAAQLAKLRAAAEAMQKKHAPVLEQYTSLGKQAAAARKANNLKSATLLEIKRNKLKPAAIAARAEVKVTTSALAEAKSLAAARNKPAKDALAPIANLKKQITAQNKLYSAMQAERSEADKRYKAAVKAGDATNAAAAMKLSYSKMGEIRTMTGRMYSWEQQISTALRSAELKLPK